MLRNCSQRRNDSASGQPGKRNRAAANVVKHRTVQLQGGSKTSNFIYVHRDHLNSVDVITDQVGNIVDGFGYDPFGQRRLENWAGDITPAELNEIIANTHIRVSRGFTDHEHLDRVRIIHMNGRIYEPTIGRFLSADPVVPHPIFSQSYNRYSYVMNSPLSFTDPSGFHDTDTPHEHSFDQFDVLDSVYEAESQAALINSAIARDAVRSLAEDHVEKTRKTKDSRNFLSDNCEISGIARCVKLESPVRGRDEIGVEFTDEDFAKVHIEGFRDEVQQEALIIILDQLAVPTAGSKIGVEIVKRAPQAAKVGKSVVKEAKSIAKELKKKEARDLCALVTLGFLCTDGDFDANNDIRRRLERLNDQAAEQAKPKLRPIPELIE